MPASIQNPKVAIVHEWFASYAGSERVVEQLLHVYPDADLYALVDFLGDGERSFLGGRPVRTSFIQRLPGARRWFRNYLALMPAAIEQFDLSAYDLVISSNHAAAKGVITGPNQVHVSYVHSPMRYAWDLQHQYLRESGLKAGLKSTVARAMLHYLRMWDVRTAHGVDCFVANSRYIGRRIAKTYGRDAVVIYPPVDVERFRLQTVKEDYYLAASRLVPYKRMPVIAEAFCAMPDKQLVIIGDGPEAHRLREIAGDASNIQFLGYQPTDVVVEKMGRAKAFVFAAEEDFGITVVEAQACGTPVIAFGRGGARETVVDSADAATRTGLLFDAQSTDSIRAAVHAFESAPAIDPHVCRANAERFSIATFRHRIADVVARAMASHSDLPHPDSERKLYAAT